MRLIRAHPYISALCATGIVVLLGIWIVERQSRIPVSNTITAWEESGAGIFDPTSYAPTQNTETQERTVPVYMPDNAPYTYISPTIFNGVGTRENPPDLTDLFFKLTEGISAKPSPTDTDTAIEDAYSFTPSGFVTPTIQNTRSTAQEAIYQYANNVGSRIQALEERYPAAIIILRDQVEDRTNPQKAAAVEEFARTIENVGNDLQSTVVNIPEGFTSAHMALAKSYAEIGKNLALVPQTTTDESFLQAIETYNASADRFTENYIALAMLFGAYGVTFNATDAGSVFTFMPMGSF